MRVLFSNGSDNSIRALPCSPKERRSVIIIVVVVIAMIVVVVVVLGVARP